MAIRPKTLSAGFAPVFLAGVFSRPVALNDYILLGCCLAVAIVLQIVANMANDYCDWRKGVDTSDRLGPTRVVSSGLLDPVYVVLAILACLGLAGLIGLFAAWLSGRWLIVVVGGVCMLLAWLYSGSKVPLSHLPLGEVTAFLFFGIVACCGTAYVLNRPITPAVILGSVMCGLFSAAIMAVNNLRDVNTDKPKGKITLAVLLGHSRARVFPCSLLLSAVLVPVIMAFWYSRPVLAVGSLVLPMAVRCSIGLMCDPLDRRFNRHLGAASACELLSSLLLGAAWLI